MPGALRGVTNHDDNNKDKTTTTRTRTAEITTATGDVSPLESNERQEGGVPDLAAHAYSG